MGNAFQDQFLKAGVVTRQQVKKAQSEKNRKNKQQHSKKAKPVDEAKLKAQQVAKEKAAADRELNRKKEEQAKQKAISAEIDQLISKNCIKRNDEDCDIVYNFEHRKKVNRVYVNKDMKQDIIDGKLGIARIEGRYELVPRDIAEKIQQRNEKRLVLFEKEDDVAETDSENDPYAEFKVPDDLVW